MPLLLYYFMAAFQITFQINVYAPKEGLQFAIQLIRYQVLVIVRWNGISMLKTYTHLFEDVVDTIQKLPHIFPLVIRKVLGLVWVFVEVNVRSLPRKEIFFTH